MTKYWITSYELNTYTTWFFNSKETVDRFLINSKNGKTIVIIGQGEYND